MPNNEPNYHSILLGAVDNYISCAEHLAMHCDNPKLISAHRYKLLSLANQLEGKEPAYFIYTHHRRKITAVILSMRQTALKLRATKDNLKPCIVYKRTRKLILTPKIIPK